MKSKIEKRRDLVIEILRNNKVTLSELTVAIERDDRGWAFASGSRDGISYKTLFRDLLHLEKEGKVKIHNQYYPRRFELA